MHSGRNDLVLVVVNTPRCTFRLLKWNDYLKKKVLAIPQFISCVALVSILSKTSRTVRWIQLSKWEMISYLQGNQNYCSVCFQSVWIAGIGVIYHIIHYNMNALDHLSILSCKVVYIGCMLCKMFDCEMHSLASFVTNIGNDHAFCFIIAPNCLHQNPFGHGTGSHTELNSFLKYKSFMTVFIFIWRNVGWYWSTVS